MSSPAPPSSELLITVELTTLSFWSPAEDLDLGRPAGLAVCRVVATSRAAGAGLDAGAAVRAGGEVGDLQGRGRRAGDLEVVPGAGHRCQWFGVAPERPTAAVVTLIVRIAGLGSVFWALSVARTWKIVGPVSEVRCRLRRCAALVGARVDRAPEARPGLRGGEAEGRESDRWWPPRVQRGSSCRVARYRR